MRQLLQLAHHAVVNSMELLDDASLLLQHGRWSRSHALAVLALEELGKAGLCLAALAYEESQSRDFWKDFTHHPSKLLQAGAILEFLGGDHASATAAVVAQIQTEATREHARKLRGLYVDLSRSGAVELPDEVDEEAARRVIGHVRKVVDLLGPAWTGEALLDRLDEIEAHSDELRTLFSQARQLVLLDPDAAIAIGRAGIRGEIEVMD